jgi:hypothetical protein
MNVAIEGVFSNLTAAFSALREAFENLGLTVIEDRPARGEVLLVERLGNLVDDLNGWTQESCASVAEAAKAIAHPPDLYRARRALGTAHEGLLRVQFRFFGDAVSFDAIEALLSFADERGHEWSAWSKSVVQALDACRSPLRASSGACLQAWLELGERFGRTLSLQNTTIGQHVSAPPPRATSVHGGEFT